MRRRLGLGLTLLMGGCFSHSTVFSEPHHFYVGRSPTAVATADFNGDGKADLAVALLSSRGLVAVMLGRGDGNFLEPHDFAVGRSPAAIVTADFNGDGKTDLAVANNGNPDGDRSDGNVSVLLGNGDGTFQHALVNATTASPWSLAVGDFNGDGKADLVVADTQHFGRLQVLLGNGSGTFQAGRVAAAGAFPSALAVGDVNGDGKLDVAVTLDTEWVGGASRGGTLAVLLGDGSGGFAKDAVHTTLEFGARAIALADLNGDHKLDVATANGGAGVLLGNGDGTFRREETWAAPNETQSIAIADVNGDDRLDLVLTRCVLLGHGDGQFDAATVYAPRDGLTAEPIAVATPDLNGDGRPDIAMATFGSNTVVVALNGAEGARRPPPAPVVDGVPPAGNPPAPVTAPPPASTTEEPPINPND